MQIKRLAVLGQLHHFLGALPVLVLGILREELLFQRLDAVHIALAIELRALLHGLERRPALGIHNVRILERFCHGVGDLELAAIGLGVLLGNLHHLVHNLVALGIGQRHVHAKAGHEADDALRDGEGLAVAGAVGPGHGHLLALQVLDAAHLMDDVQGVRHALRGMVDVALEVDQRGLLLEHAVLIALGHGVYDLVHVGIALADVHVVANADNVRHEGDHVGGLAHRFAVRDLALALVQILDLKTQQVAGRGEGEARAGAVIAEQRDAEAGVENLRGNVVLAQVPQRVCNSENRLDLILRFFPGQEEIALIHIGKVQFFKDIGVLLDVGFLAHIALLYF